MYTDPVNSYKAVIEVNAAPKKAMEYFIPGPSRVRRKWDDTVKVSRAICCDITLFTSPYMYL